MSKIKISEAGPRELRNFAVLNLGLEIEDDISTEKLRSKIRGVFKGDEIPAPAPSNTTQQTAAPPPWEPPAEGLIEEPWVTILIHEVDEPGGSDAVPLSVNGRAMYVERSVESPIHYSYFEVLERAIKTVWHQKKGTNERIRQDSPMYPYTVLVRAHPEHVKAWRAQDAHLSDTANQAARQTNSARLVAIAAAAGVR